MSNIAKNCTPITNEEYVEAARKSGTQVQWLGGTYRDEYGKYFEYATSSVADEFDERGIKAQKCVIATDSEWREFARSCLVVREKDGVYYYLKQ